MRLLFLTQYFPPETGAPQNRLYELAVRLKKSGADITVLTALPNYPGMEIYPHYKGKWRAHETLDGLNIYRSWIFVRKSKSVFWRLLNYFSFVFSSLFAGLFRIRNIDVVICESPPLFLGITAYFLKNFYRAKLVFNVSDLWPESALRLGLVTNHTFLSLASRLEEFMYRKSELISGQTQGIVQNISSRFPTKKTYWLPNGVDLDYFRYTQESNWRKENNFSGEDFILSYAGIIGHAQGLEVILKAARILKEYTAIKFVLTGTGPEKEMLMEMKQREGLSNVCFFENCSKSKMPELISAVDASVIPLKKLDLFKGAIPSKIFESLAMKKPILLGVEGEAKELFIDQGKAGLAFIPEDESDLAKQSLVLFNSRELGKTLGENGYSYVRQKFNRDAIAEEFRRKLQELQYLNLPVN